MRKRNNNVRVRLDEDEYKELMKMVKKSGLTTQEYILSLIKDKPLIERPSEDFCAVIKLMQCISNNMNQIAVKANALGFVDTVAYWQNAQELQRTIGRMIGETYGTGKETRN